MISSRIFSRGRWTVRLDQIYEPFNLHLRSAEFHPFFPITLAFFPAGLMERWIVEQFLGLEAEKAKETHTSVYTLLDREAEKLENPTGICILPHLVGSCNPFWDSRASAIIAGIKNYHTKHHIYKAVYEGIACELALNLGILESLTGPINALYMSGGGAKSAFTVDIRSAITGKKIIKLNTSETVCQGAAMLAGLGTGLFKNPEEAVKAFVKSGSSVEPNNSLAAAYAEQCAKYNTLYPATADFRKI
jgi:xylulokinase